MVVTFIMEHFFAFKVDRSDVNPAICPITSQVFENFCLFATNSTWSVQNQEIYFQYILNCVFLLWHSFLGWRHSVNFKSNKIHENKIFVKQDIIQFFSGVFIVTDM